MAAAAILGVALSIIPHELGHTFVGRAFGLPVTSITLFAFGGVAELATRIAARAGEVIALLMIGLGGLAAITLELGAGLWWIVLGWFIYAMARAHRTDAEARLLLSGARVGDLMTPNPITAPAEMSVAEFVETVLWRTPHELIPVMAGETLLGAAGFSNAKAAPREAWPRTRLADIATPLAGLVRADRSEPIETALDRLRTAHASGLIVLDRTKVAGVLTLSDIAAHLRLRFRPCRHAGVIARSGRRRRASLRSINTRAPKPAPADRGGSQSCAHFASRASPSA